MSLFELYPIFRVKGPVGWIFFCDRSGIEDVYSIPENSSFR